MIQADRERREYYRVMARVALAALRGYMVGRLGLTAAIPFLDSLEMML